MIRNFFCFVKYFYCPTTPIFNHETREIHETPTTSGFKGWDLVKIKFGFFFVLFMVLCGSISFFAFVSFGCFVFNKELDKFVNSFYTT